MNTVIDKPATMSPSPNRRAHATFPVPVRPLVAVLRQLADVIRSLSDSQYAMKPVGVVASSIGGHVRHCLDHLDTFLHGLYFGVIDYDQRQRGTEIETNRRAALVALHRQERQFLACPGDVAGWPLRLRVLLSSDSSPIEVETSAGRELAFVLSHTIHHNSLIAVLARSLGVSVPARFGYAPATIAHLERTS